MKIDKKIISYDPNSIVGYYFPVQYVFIMYDKKYIVIQKEEKEKSCRCHECDARKYKQICNSLLCKKKFRKDKQYVIFKIIG